MVVAEFKIENALPQYVQYYVLSGIASDMRTGYIAQLSCPCLICVSECLTNQFLTDIPHTSRVAF